MDMLPQLKGKMKKFGSGNPFKCLMNAVQILREIQPGINVPSEYDCEKRMENLLSKCKF